jgi:hypothetical protein
MPRPTARKAPAGACRNPDLIEIKREIVADDRVSHGPVSGATCDFCRMKPLGVCGYLLPGTYKDFTGRGLAHGSLYV